MTDTFQVKRIYAAEVPDDPVRCPQCKGGNLNLKGHLKRVYDTVQENGQDVETYQGDVLFQEIDHIECRDCRVRFTVVSRIFNELEQVAAEMEARLLLLNGEVKQC